MSAIVKGKRSVINEMKKTGLTATVDVADASEGKNRGKVELELPSGVTLDSISDDTISYRVEKSIEVKKTVETILLETQEMIRILCRGHMICTRIQ